MRNRTWQRVLLPVWLIVAGCTMNETGLGTINIPTVGSQHNSFAFAVVARSLDLDRSYALTFDADSVSVGLAVTGYGNGFGSLELRDAAGHVVFSRDLTGNVAEGTSAPVRARPATAHLQFGRYTGVVAIGVHASQ